MLNLRFCLLLILFSIAIPTFAHDGEIHPDDLEFIVSGIGLIAIILTAFYVYFSNERDDKKR